MPTGFMKSNTEDDEKQYIGRAGFFGIVADKVLVVSHKKIIYRRIVILTQSLFVVCADKFPIFTPKENCCGFPTDFS